MNNKELIEKYFPKTAIELLKNKANRYKFLTKDESKNLDFIDYLEDMLIQVDNLNQKRLIKYCKKVIKLASKNPIYLFESKIFDDEFMDKFFDKGPVNKIKTAKQKIIDDIVDKDTDDLTRKDYLIIISQINNKNRDLKLTGLMYKIYRDLLNKDNISFYEAEFLIKYTIHFSKSNIYSYISNTDLYDDRIKDLSYFSHNKEIRILVFSKSAIKKIQKQKNKDYTTSTEIVLNTLRAINYNKDLNNLYNGVINYKTLEIAITSLLTKYRYLKDAVFSYNHQETLDAIKFYETKIQKNEGVKRMEKDILEEDYFYLLEDDIRFLDEIIYYYPEELEDYEILKNFYNEDGTRKMDACIETDDANLDYILSLFDLTKRKPKLYNPNNK